MITPEWITALATAGTFFVILASAIAALKQLSHMRGSNQITALTECRETLESPEFRAAQHFISYDLPERFKDPDEARKISIIPFVGEYQAIDIVANFFESMGLFVKSDIIDEKIACDFWGYVVLRNWNSLVPVITYVRHTLNNHMIWENFEYMALLSQKFTDANPRGAYPRGTPRMPEDSSLLDLIRRG